MPTYAYRCVECGHEFEDLQSIAAEPLVKCPNCGKDTLKRGLGGGTGMIFKGQGFYQTDYKKSGEKKPTEKKEPSAPKKTGPSEKESTDKTTKDSTSKDKESGKATPKKPEGEK